MNFAQKMRLVWIAGALADDKPFQRKDLCAAFDISLPQASADISAFRDRYPTMIRYDNRLRAYFRKGRDSAFDQDILDTVAAAQCAVAALS